MEDINKDIKELEESIKEAYRCYDYDLDYNPLSKGIAEIIEHLIKAYKELEEDNKQLKTEMKKKDKIIDSIKEYAQQEIDFATEDIKDYIDDDREGNKDIIGELKEWREHWKDIIRIMNNEKTYIDFEYKVEEEK